LRRGDFTFKGQHDSQFSANIEGGFCLREGGSGIVGSGTPGDAVRGPVSFTGAFGDPQGSGEGRREIQIGRKKRNGLSPRNGEKGPARLAINLGVAGTCRGGSFGVFWRTGKNAIISARGPGNQSQAGQNGHTIVSICARLCRGPSAAPRPSDADSAEARSEGNRGPWGTRDTVTRAPRTSEGFQGPPGGIVWQRDPLGATRGRSRTGAPGPIGLPLVADAGGAVTARKMNSIGAPTQGNRASGPLFAGSTPFSFFQTPKKPQPTAGGPTRRKTKRKGSKLLTASERSRNKIGQEPRRRLSTGSRQIVKTLQD